MLKTVSHNNNSEETADIRKDIRELKAQVEELATLLKCVIGPNGSRLEVTTSKRRKKKLKGNKSTHNPTSPSSEVKDENQKRKKSISKGVVVVEGDIS